MADGPAIGTAYLRVAGDFSQVNAQAVGLFKSSKWSSLGKVAGVALAGGLVAGGALKALYDIGQQFDDVSDKIRTQTGATGKELGKLEESFKKVISGVPADFDQASSAIAGLNQRLDLSGKPLQKLSKQMLELSRITETDVEGNVTSVTRAFADWEVGTRKQTDTLDFFFRASQASGASVAELSELIVQFGAPLRRFGFSVEEATSMFALFEKSGVNIQTMMPGLKLALSEFLESGRDPEQALAKTFAGIESGAIKADEAIEIFGKRAGSDMVEAIEQGRFKFEEFTGVIADGSDTIRQAGRDTMDFSEHWMKFKNNVLVALEPVATRVFEGLGEAMKDITKIVADPKLSSGEKLQALTRLVMDAVGDLAEKVGKAAPTIALELVKGFVNAPILGQLVLGGLLLKKLGGAKGFSTLGRTLGSKLGAGLAIGLALAFPELIQKAFDLGKKIGEAIKEGIGTDSTASPFGDLTKGGILKEFGFEGLQQYFEEVRGFSSSKAAEKTNDVLAQMSERMDTLDKRAKRASDSWRESFRKIAESTDNQGGKASGYWDHWLGNIADTSRDKGERSRNILKDIFGDVADSADDKGGDIYRNWDKWLDRTADTGKTASNRFKNQVSGNFVNLANASIDAIGGLAGETNKTLASLKVKDQVYVARKVGGGGGNATLAQKGAVLVPGTGMGDKVPLHLDGRLAALVEPGELVSVANRNATAALMKVNKEIPRFQGGGMVDPAGPGTGVVNQAIAAVVGAWSKRYDAAINYGYDPGGGHRSPGHNVTGTATDTGPAQGWYGAPLDLFESGLRAIVGKVDQILYGTAGIGTPYLDHGRGNHAHIEWGMHPDVQGAIEASLARYVIEGPAGPPRSAGQAAIDRVRKAAGGFARSKLGGIGGADFGSMDVSGSDAALMKRISSQRGWNFADWWALDAAETSHGTNLTNPTSTARLRGQFLDMNWGKYGPGSDPAAHPSMAEQIISMGRYIAERYRNPTAAWAFHQAHNYYKRGGIVPMLQGGGLLKLAKGGIAKLFPQLGAKKGPRRHKALGQILDKVKGLGLDPASFERLNALTNDSGIFQEFADRASQLTIEPFDETGEAILGKVNGLSEVEWLNKALETVFGLRNSLIGAESKVAKRMTQVGEMIGVAKERVQKLFKLLRDTNTAVEDNERRQRQIVKEIEQARAKLEAELGRPQSQRSQGAIDHQRSRIERLRGDLAQLGEKKAGLLGVQTRASLERGTLKDKVIPEMTTKRTDLVTLRGDVLGSGGEGFDGLVSVQGLGAPLNALTQLPEMGTLGGTIFDLQSRLRELNAPKEAITDSLSDSGGGVESESAEILKQLLQESNRRLAVSQAQYSVFAGMFGGGGKIPSGAWGIAGETGIPEIIQGPATVYSPTDSQQMRAPSVPSVVIQQLTIHEDGRATMRYEGREFEVAVEKVNRRQSNRAVSY